MKKKIYISLPIKIDEKTVSKRYKEALTYVKENLSDYEPIGPINIEELSKLKLIIEDYSEKEQIRSCIREYYKLVQNYAKAYNLPIFIHTRKFI